MRGFRQASISMHRARQRGGQASRVGCYSVWYFRIDQVTYTWEELAIKALLGRSGPPRR